MPIIFLAHFLLLTLPSLPLLAAAPSLCPPLPPHPASTHFNVLVPNRTSFTQLVDCSLAPQLVRGFAVDVFEAARSILAPDPDLPLSANVSYHCFDLSSGGTFDDMVDCLSQGSFDAIVGDVTITGNRMKNASFTLPYLDSGIVLLAPTVGRSTAFLGIFFAPFAAKMWGMVLAFLVFTGYVLWSLEHKSHVDSRLIPQKQQIPNVLWFVASLLVFVKTDKIKNPLSKVVLIGWIGFVVVLGSTYIATLSAILTVQNLSPENFTMTTLQNGTIKIGYRQGTASADYLKQRLKIPEIRLVNLTDPEDYVAALSEGRVDAIVDEAPYVNLFLSGLPADNCVYVVVNASSKLTSEGFGFAFPIRSNSDLAVKFSTAILNLSENGQLLKLQKGGDINDSECATQIQSISLDLDSSQGVFLFQGLVLCICTGTVIAKLMRHRVQNRNFTRIEELLLRQADAIIEQDAAVFRKSASFTSDSSPHYLSRQETFS